MSGEKDLGDWLLHELYIAYLEARKNKRKTSDEHKFELNAMLNIMALRDDILNHRYKPSRGIAFIIYDPVMREIFAAPFRDRIVHHFLYNQVESWWDARFIYDSYSCRKGKGVLFAIKRLQEHMRKVSKNGTRKAYVMKFDIQGYFMSLPREKIFERICWGLDRQFPEKKWLHDLLFYLWKEIIFDDPTKGAKIKGSVLEWRNLPESKSLFFQPQGQGIVIGNLSSQLISNIYLDRLDRFIKYELGYKNYGRYVDDFFIIVDENDYKKALKDIDKIDRFLYDELGLTLHPKKRYIQDVKHGVPFLGTVVYLNNIVPSKRFKNNFYRASYKYSIGFNSDESVLSYLGYLKNINGKKLSKKIFDKNGFEYHY